MATVRRAHAKWEGDLINGKGSVKFDTGALPEVPVTWRARSEDAQGKTSPEELLAGAHAACFAMALSHGLATKGNPPQRLGVDAACTFAKVGDGFKVTEMVLTVTGKVPGIDRAKFEEIAKATGEKGCPISQALAGNVPIKVIAVLE
jgi:osmotically inducible protein OsmC